MIEYNERRNFWLPRTSLISVKNSLSNERSRSILQYICRIHFLMIQNVKSINIIIPRKYHHCAIMRKILPRKTTMRFITNWVSRWAGDEPGLSLFLGPQHQLKTLVFLRSHWCLSFSLSLVSNDKLCTTYTMMTWMCMLPIFCF